MSTDLPAKAKNAFKGFAESNPGAAKALEEYITGLRDQNVVALGTDEAFALRDQSGEIKAFRQRLVLSAANGGLVQPVYHGPWVISAQGYQKWAEAAGACVINADKVLVDGVWQQNPYVVRDSANGRTKLIYCRAVAFRFSSKGLPMVSDRTTIFDVAAYRMIDLLAKAKKTPHVFKLLPNQMGAPEEDGTWACYAFDESTNLWLNTAHNEALEWFSSIINREKKAIDFAQTFAQRNALKHLSGLQKAPGQEWQLTVLCWRPANGGLVKWDPTTYAQVQKRAEALSHDPSQFALPEGRNAVTIDMGTDHVEDEAELISAEADPEDGQGAEQAPAWEESQDRPVTGNEVTMDESKLTSTKRPSDPETAKIMAQYDAAAVEFPKEMSRARKALGIRDDQLLTTDMARAVVKKISQLLDEEAA